jgi:branched-chain amino acid transport system permease protein
MSEFLLAVVFGVTQGSIYAAVAVGLVLVFGVTDIVNFAYGEIVTLGAFGVILFAPKIGFAPALIGTVVVLAIASALVYEGAFKFTMGNHLQGLVLSLGLLLIIQNSELRIFGGQTRDGPSVSGILTIPGVGRIGWSRIIVLVALLVAVAVVYSVLRWSWVGIALRACGSDQYAAATVGLSARRVGLYAFALSGVLAAAAGVAIAAIYPVTPLIGFSFLLKGFVVVIIGGTGSVMGALVASLALGVIESLGVTYISPSISTVYGLVLMIAVLLIAPNGLFNRAARRAG